ncbi:MAG TPA: DUF4130 domain-containing protein [Thermoanaerobaculia bacterium]|nr:DUF4130 domain-containing protein [Thermoanaerobaculia bacterium]
MRNITFDPSWRSWRRSALEALRDGVPPSDVVWVPDEPDVQTTLPLVGGDPSRAPASTARGRLSARVDSGRISGDRISRDFERHGEVVVHHRREDRFDLLYRLLWRMNHDEPDLLANMLDPEVFRFRRMAAAVRDDLKQARSHLRLNDPGCPRPGRQRPAVDRLLPDLVGWCEPRHRTLPLLAEELAQRYPRRSFALLSPLASAFWDGSALDHGAGGSREVVASAEELARRWEARHRVAA